MNQAWFVVTWDLDSQKWSGPFESKEAASDFGWEKKQENDFEFEYCGIVGPIEFELLHQIEEPLPFVEELGAEPGTMGTGN